MSSHEPVEDVAPRTAEDDEDEEWELVPKDFQSGGISVPDDPRNWKGSRCIFELRLSIGSKEWKYVSQPTHKHRDEVFDLSGNNREQISAAGSLLQQGQLLLFQIPIEIRLYIYELVFTLPPTAKMICNTAGNIQTRQPSSLALLETCHLVLREAETIFYSINRLRLDSDPIPSYLSFRRRESIKAVAILSNDASKVWTHVQALRLAPKLQSLHIISPSSSIRYVNVRNWAVMRPQIETSLRSLKELEDVKVFWKGTAPHTAEGGELERERKFAELVKRLEASVALP